MKKRTTLVFATVIAAVGALGLAACGTNDDNGNDDPITLGHTTHSYTETAVDPTCTEQGYTLHKCACGDEYKDNYVNATGHSFVTYTYNNDATCVEAGTETATCENCTATDTQESETHPATGVHTFNNYTYNNDATCVEAGTETATCEHCTATYIQESETHPATGVHTFNNYTYNNDATCIEAGTETATCEHCTATDTQESEAHPATGHSFITYTYNNDATCVEAGTETATCEHCTATDTQESEAHPATEIHTYDDYLCKVCNKIDPDVSATAGLYFAGIISGGSVVGYEVSKGEAGSNKWIKIPSEYNGKPVTSIGKNAFFNCTSLISIDIPNSVTSIGESAFSFCSSLASIVIPNSVTSIGRRAFYGCTSMTGITFAEKSHLTSIEIGTFVSCGNLTSIIIPISVTSLGNNVFVGCGSLTIYCEAASKPSEWSSNWNSSCPVVWDCKNNDRDKNGYAYAVINELLYNLKNGIATVIEQPKNVSGNVTIPSSVIYKGEQYSVKSIWSLAFAGCSNLTSIEIPNSVTSINGGAFPGCNSLESITVQRGNTRYHSSGNCIIETASKTLIAGCKNSVIPTDGSVTSIGDYALDGCSNLICITIPNSVTRIGDSAFDGCSSLTSIEIPNSVTSIGGGAFVGCNSLTSITIPNSITSIGESAFWLCSSLTSIVIPNSVMSIGNSVFYDCSSLTIYCEAASKPSEWSSNWNSSYPVVWDCKNNDRDGDGYAYAVIDRVRYSLKDGIATVIRQSSNISGDITIPSNLMYKDEQYSVTSVDNNAFDGCSSLTSIVIPNSITSIGSNAFKGCSSLSSIIIPNSVTSIGEYAFYGCSSLIIYCESLIKPNGWDNNWNTNRPVVWGHRISE